MKIDQIVRSIKSYKIPVRSIKTELDVKNIDFQGYWSLGICNKDGYGKHDGGKFYTTICGYGHVVKDGNDHKIRSASTTYFKEANAYITYSYFWCDIESMKNYLENIKTKSGIWYLGISYIPVGFEKIVYKNGDKFTSML